MDDFLEDFENEEFSIEEMTSLGGDESDEEDYQEEEEEDYDSEDSEEESEEDFDDSDEESEDEHEESDDEFEEDSEDEETYVPFIESLLEDGVLEWDGETEYEDSPEGFRAMVQDNIESGVNKYLASLPEDVQRLIEIGINGGDIREAFTSFEEVDYSQANIEDEDVAKALIRDYYVSTNPKWNDARINKQLEMLEDAGELEEEAKLAQEFLVEQTEAQREEYLQNLAAQREAQEQAYYTELNEYTSMIDETDGFFGLEFSSIQEKEAFKAYCFERGEDGLTQAERDDADKGVRLAKEFYKFRKFGFEDIERKATTKTSLGLKKHLSRFADRNAKSNRGATTRTDGNKKFSLGRLPDED